MWTESRKMEKSLVNIEAYHNKQLESANICLSQLAARILYFLKHMCGAVGLMHMCEIAHVSG